MLFAIALLLHLSGFSLGPLDANAVSDAAQIMARELGWSEAERAKQIQSIEWRYKPLARAR